MYKLLILNPRKKISKPDYFCCLGECLPWFLPVDFIFVFIWILKTMYHLHTFSVQYIGQQTHVTPSRLGSETDHYVLGYPHLHSLRWLLYANNKLLHHIVGGSGCKKGGRLEHIFITGSCLSAAVVFISCEHGWKVFIECSFNCIVSLHHLIEDMKISVLVKKGIMIVD